MTKGFLSLRSPSLSCRGDFRQLNVTGMVAYMQREQLFFSCQGGILLTFSFDKRRFTQDFCENIWELSWTSENLHDFIYVQWSLLAERVWCWMQKCRGILKQLFFCKSGEKHDLEASDLRVDVNAQEMRLMLTTKVNILHWLM